MSPLYGDLRGPIGDNDWFPLMRNWKVVDLAEGDNAAQFLATVVCVVSGAATMVTTGDIMDSSNVTGVAEAISRRVYEASEIVENQQAARQ